MDAFSSAMGEQKKWPIELKVKIGPQGMEEVVREGRLMEFVNAFSTVAGEQIKAQLVEQLATSGPEALGGIRLNLAFDVDEPYGTGPRPGPFSKIIQDGAFERVLRESMLKR